MGEGRRAAPQSHFWWQSVEMSHSGEFKIGGSMESLLEMVYTNWEFITKLCEFYPRKQIFLGF